MFMFLLGVVGVGLCFFLHHLRGAFVSPQTRDLFRIILPRSVVTNDRKKRMFINDLKPHVAYYYNHHATWHVLSWNHEESPCVQNVCLSNAKCGGVHTLVATLHFSIRVLVLGQHNTEYSLPTPPTVDHSNHITQFVWSNIECNIDYYMV
jgi:hypothetical protein